MTSLIGHLARWIGGPMDGEYEPYLPRLTDAATTRSEYQLLYRSPETGEEFSHLTDGTRVWAERKHMLEAGYQVVVTKRQITTSAWEVMDKPA